MVICDCHLIGKLNRIASQPCPLRQLLYVGGLHLTGRKRYLEEMAMMPSVSDVPISLLALDSNCGPVSVWMVLRSFGKRVSANRIIRACRHSKKCGSFGIALALAMQEFGLSVRYHTEPDPDIQPLESSCYKLARRRGIQVNGAIDVTALRLAVKRGPVIVYMPATDGEPHFSPLVGFRRGKALLAYTNDKRLPIDEFDRRWSSPGYCRQCILTGQ
jgi:hypothetical protein